MLESQRSCPRFFPTCMLFSSTWCHSRFPGTCWDVGSFHGLSEAVLLGQRWLNYQPVGLTHPAAYLCKIKFYWNMATLIHLHILCGCFGADGRIECYDRVHMACKGSNTYYYWTFKKKFPDSWLRHTMKPDLLRSSHLSRGPLGDWGVGSLYFHIPSTIVFPHVYPQTQ